MQGRSVEQRAALSKAIVNELAEMFPLLPRIAANIAEFEQATYFNRAMMQLPGPRMAPLGMPIGTD
ncbi:putative 5-carboxymethyl-2-hydroxymuconate delta-isomerase [Lysobacter antibioticus]|uniref:Putative 5-carboxymethyl-2-hydroxymuconate delta-isomerase n=2 Tax=Lysobacter antibioticus TaxID=84531 RepID=A0A0S2F528_LYSAN|nr:putative 5-carboxymethyl-2-hydroxymuconate delta-isomerase [Lysobacter antibioticus]ALN78663.1 putative 5-carboxymethyl-2-hydroxymuconate delta-isomerase [Lysobacter antibioticus]